MLLPTTQVASPNFIYCVNEYCYAYSKGAHIPFFRENVVLKMTFVLVLNEQELQHLTRNLERVFQYLPKIASVW